MPQALHFPRLFEPCKIRDLKLKNRIVLAPMGTGTAGVWGEVTDDMIAWYARRAEGGAALIIVEAAHVATALDPAVMVNRLNADDERFCSGLARLAESVHEAGAKIAIQLTPGAGAQGIRGPWTPGLENIQDITPVAPSPVPSPVFKKLPRELSVSEIEKFIELMGRAAERVKRVGFDAVEIHGHAGYLIGEFLSPYFNKRTDKYGGDLRSRCRFLLEMVHSMRERMGPGTPILVRYSIDEFHEGGLTLEDGLEVACLLESAGVDAIDVSCGIYGSRRTSIDPMYYPDGYMLPLSTAVKDAVSIPVIIAGGLGNPELAEQVLRENKGDIISLGRPLIADPDLPLKAAAGNGSEVRRCIRCNVCLESAMQGIGIRCAVNPVAGRERRYDRIRPADKTKRVFVIGAGPAGMEAARVAAIRGHSVTLYEKDGQLGGQLRVASVPPHKSNVSHIIDFHTSALGKLENIDVELGCEVDAAAIAAQKPDVVVVATGGVPLVPDIPGIDGATVFTANDVLAGEVELGDRVAVIGAGLVGCETANYLAQTGKAVTIVSRRERIGSGIEALTLLALKDELASKNVMIVAGAELEEVKEKGIVVTDKMGLSEFIEADAVVLARGSRAVNTLATALRDKVGELYTVGDAKEPRGIGEAIYEGFVAGYRC